MLADKVGFDAVVVNEHHNTSYSMMAAPSLIAAAIIPQIKNAKICVWGTPPNLEYPNRLAEEYAMLDVMSQGRLEVAFPLGTGMEYWANPINPATARERHRELIDIILQAWTQDGPTTYYGDFYTYRYLNPWPRPYQKPHPPCYIVGTGSQETIDLAAKLGFGYSSVFVTKQRALELNQNLRRLAAEHGHHIRPEQLPVQVIAYVAETKEKAEQEAIEHIRFFFEDALRTTPTFLAPPGYLSVAELKKRAALADKLHGAFNFDNINELFFVAVGTADQVVEQLEEWGERLGTNHFNILGAIGNMPHWKVVKNLSFLGQDVIPRMRARAASRAPRRRRVIRIRRRVCAWPARTPWPVSNAKLTPSMASRPPCSPPAAVSRWCSSTAPASGTASISPCRGRRNSASSFPSIQALATPATIRV